MAIAWRPLAVACGGAFVAAISTSVVGVSIPVIAKSFEATTSQASWVLSGYLLAASIFLAFAGRAADLLGRKRIYLTGFLVFVSASLMCAAAANIKMLVGARIFQGAGAACLMAVGPAIVTRSVPAEQRARGLGIQIGVTYVGLTIGPSVGGLIAGALGWNAIFIVTAIVAGAGGLAALIVLDPDEARDEKHTISSFDVSGAGFLAFALGTLIASMRGADAERPFALLAALFGMSVVSFYVFWRHEAAHPNPLLPPSLMKTRPFALGIVGGVILYTITFILSFLLPFHLQQVFEYTPRQAGIIMTAQPATMAVVAPLAGIFADRFGPRVPATLGMLALGGGLLLVSSAPASMISLAVVGFGAGLYTTPNNAMIMGAAPKDRQATAGAFAATARNVGMTFGVALAAVLDRSFGFATSLRIAAGLAAVGAVLALFR